jgi:hypothetical protein
VKWFVVVFKLIFGLKPILFALMNNIEMNHVSELRFMPSIFLKHRIYFF